MPFSSMARMRVASVYRAGGLGEVLGPVKVLQGSGSRPPAGRAGGGLLLLLLVLALLVHGGVAGEFQAGGAGPEAVSRRPTSTATLSYTALAIWLARKRLQIRR